MEVAVMENPGLKYCHTGRAWGISRPGPAKRNNKPSLSLPRAGLARLACKHLENPQETKKASNRGYPDAVAAGSLNASSRYRLPVLPVRAQSNWKREFFFGMNQFKIPWTHIAGITRAWRPLTRLSPP
jgi:hypothetical protein